MKPLSRTESKFLKDINHKESFKNNNLCDSVAYLHHVVSKSKYENIIYYK